MVHSPTPVPPGTSTPSLAELPAALDASAEVRAWVEALALSPHPEGGFFRETFRAERTLARSALPETSSGLGFAGDRATLTSIYYLVLGASLTGPGRVPGSSFHRLAADEIWYHHAGAPLILHVLEEGGGYHTRRLDGRPGGDGEPQVVIPTGAWFGASVEDPDGYTLAGCAVAPGFDFADFEMAESEVLASRFPEQRDLIERLTPQR